MNKILISDYDDTLFIDENGIKENVLKIKEFRKAGNKFIISTARNYESIIEEIEKYDIEVDYLICNIGTVILEKSGKIINAIYLTAEQIENIEKILTDVSNIQIIRFGTNKSEEKGCKNLVEYKIIGEKSVLDELKTKITNLYPDFNIEIIENQRLLVEISSKEKARKYYPSFNNIKVAILGLTFKANTDDLRDAPSLNNIPILLKEGAIIKAFDPIGEKNYKNIYPDEIEYCKSIEDALQDSELCFIFTDWDWIKCIETGVFKKYMKSPIILDGRNCFKLDEIDEGIVYESIGRKIIK